MGQRRASERQRTRREADRQTEQALGTMSRPQCKPSKSIKARMDPPPRPFPHAVAKDLRLEPLLSLSVPVPPAQNPTLGSVKGTCS